MIGARAHAGNVHARLEARPRLHACQLRAAAGAADGGLDGLVGGRLGGLLAVHKPVDDGEERAERPEIHEVAQQCQGARLPDSEFGWVAVLTEVQYSPAKATSHNRE